MPQCSIVFSLASCGLSKCRVCFPCSVPEQLAAVRVHLVVDGELQDAAEVERKPAQSEHQNQTEHRLGHLPPLITKTHTHPHTSIMTWPGRDCTSVELYITEKHAALP